MRTELSTLIQIQSPKRRVCDIRVSDEAELSRAFVDLSLDFPAAAGTAKDDILIVVEGAFAAFAAGAA